MCLIDVFVDEIYRLSVIIIKKELKFNQLLKEQADVGLKSLSQKKFSYTWCFVSCTNTVKTK